MRLAERLLWRIDGCAFIMAHVSCMQRTVRQFLSCFQALVDLASARL
jgi:hypothetical protein